MRLLLFLCGGLCLGSRVAAASLCLPRFVLLEAEVEKGTGQGSGSGF